MKILYFFDDKKVFDHSEMVEDDYLVPDNIQATEIKPEDGLYEPVTFDGTKWTGATREEFLANQPEPEPTAEQLSITELAQQLADNKQHIQSIEEATTALALAQANGGK